MIEGKNHMDMKTPSDVKRHGIDWKLDLLNLLGNTASPRVLPARDFHALAAWIRPGVSPETAREVAEGFAKISALKQINTGLYLNLRATPPAQPAEAAQHVRSGAWVSLHHVLGNVGAHNNPTSIVTAVVRSTPGKRLNLGLVPPRPRSKAEEVLATRAARAVHAAHAVRLAEAAEGLGTSSGLAHATSTSLSSGLPPQQQQQESGPQNADGPRSTWGAQFHFLALDERFFPKESTDQRLLELAVDEDARCPTFTPEAALLHWIHLADQHRSTLSRPPHGDIEFLPDDAPWTQPGLRMDRLLELADRWGMSAPAHQWIREHELAHHDADDYLGIEGVEDVRLNVASVALRSKLRP